MPKRVLFCHPCRLHEAIGARVVLLSHARALVRQSLAVDRFAPAPVAIERDGNGLFLGVLDRLFTRRAPARDSALLDGPSVCATADGFIAPYYLGGRIDRALANLPVPFPRAAKGRVGFVAFHNPDRLARFVCGVDVLERGRLAVEAESAA